MPLASPPRRRFRLGMRLLTAFDGREPGFSWGGLLEVVLYGLLVGLASGLLLALVRLKWPLRSVLAGIGWGLATYAGTVLTLPPHIAQTAAPFAAIIVWVHAAFALLFALFGVTLVRTTFSR